MTFSHLKNKDEIILGSIGLKDGKIVVGAEDEKFVYITEFLVDDNAVNLINGIALATKYCNDHRIKLSEPEQVLVKAVLELLIRAIEKKKWWHF